MTTDLPTLIEHHTYWGSRDFIYSQVILWIALVASFAATILVSTATDKIPKWVIAVIAGLPALAMTVEKTFHYQERSQWHEGYSIRLEGLQSDIQSGKVAQADVGSLLKNLKEDMVKTWPAATMSSIPAEPAGPKPPTP